MKNSQAMESSAKPEYFGRDLEAMSFAVNYHNWIIDEFKPYLGASVAEVGAGTGNFTELLIASNPGIQHLVAFEPSANMYPLLEARLAGAEHTSTLNSFFGDASHQSENEFDSVIYVNVLEHVADDARELSNVYSSLGVGGHVLVFVPALSLLFSDLDRRLGHYRRYHKSELIRIIESAGFVTTKVKYLDFAGLLPWYVAFVLLKRSISGSNVASYDKLVVPVMRRLEGIVEPPIGKNLLIVGRKTV